MKSHSEKIIKRQRRHRRVRAALSGSASRPRLAVFRANQNIYAQIIDDVSQKTLASASSLEIRKAAKGAKASKTEGVSAKANSAAEVGSLIAKKALEKNIAEVVFDRGGFRYHGRIKALADAARSAGLKF